MPNNPPSIAGQKEKGTQMQKQLLTEKAIEAIQIILKKGDRVELIPVKDGVRINRIRREEIKVVGKQNDSH